MPATEKKKPLKRGRPSINSEAMTAAQRKAKQRREQDNSIQLQPTEQWSEADCLRVMTTKKYYNTAIHELAWNRLGEIHNYEQNN